ncbi:hypothetical protein [Nonomuraea turkmeniaca]|uniref:hypothetical protein n=1 Tax=Nonomuraea turkmeniaca TaxID=103838 RepID=UPI001476949F|nr:hypothetical protein [Nonomuraea turkmeniaca]
MSFECNATINAHDKRHWGTPEPRARCAALQGPPTTPRGFRSAVSAFLRETGQVSR